ncbi:UNVERIFIED_CONTAM: hypothetical protein PYX00_005465 [Menopon gallinae]|uniref:Borealin C-terminal domain-containing protein n=1 Tax=Menopon gallinae TaxID=328185 RepID=A0AAW2HT60_9NEOP
MPRRKRSVAKPLKTEENLDISGISVLDDRTQRIISNTNDCDVNLLKIEIKEKYHDFMQKLESKLEFELSRLDMAFSNIMCSIPESVMNTRVDLSDSLLRSIFVNCKDENEEFESCENIEKSPVTTRRTRSRSITSSQQLKYTAKKGNSRKRSSSLDVFKTPANKVSLAVLTTAKKYTVSKQAKKVEDSGISLKRVMKQNEEAISTTGSPLFVHPSASSLAAPTVNIPLPGGVVMNIEPKRPKGKYTIPELDEKTKSQLRILCEQLNNML